MPSRRARKRRKSMSSAALKETVINMCLYRHNNRPINLKKTLAINELLQHSNSEKHSKFEVIIWTSSDRSVREEMEKRSPQWRMPLCAWQALHPPTNSPMRYSAYAQMKPKGKKNTSQAFPETRTVTVNIVSQFNVIRCRRIKHFSDSFYFSTISSS